MMRASLLFRRDQWVDALRLALQGTPYVREARGTQHPAPTDGASRDADILQAHRLLLSAHVPGHHGEAVNERVFGLLRRCRWALVGMASMDAKADLVAEALTAYVNCAQRLMFDNPLDGDLGTSLHPPQPPSHTTPAPQTLSDASRLCLLEAIELFAEASGVHNVPLAHRHYIPFVTMPNLVALDENMIHDLVIECETRHAAQRASGSEAERNIVDAASRSLRISAATSYAAAGLGQRAMAMVPPEDLPEVVERAVRSNRWGWRRAMALASHLTACGGASTTSTGCVSTEVHHLLSRCVAADWANRVHPQPTYFECLLPPVVRALQVLNAQFHHLPGGRHAAGSASQRLVERMARLAHPSTHWREVLILFQQHLQVPLPCAPAPHADTAPQEGTDAGMPSSMRNAATGGSSRIVPSGSGSATSPSPLGRVMHVLLMAHQWQACLETYAQVPLSVRDAHVSARNYLLTANACKIAAVAGAAGPLHEKSPDGMRRDAAALESLYSAIAPANSFTHVTFLRAMVQVKHLTRFASWALSLQALRRVQSHQDAVRIMEDCAVRFGFAGQWQAAAAVLSPAGVGLHWHRSRYVGIVALAACAQQAQFEWAHIILHHVCGVESRSMKQVALASALLVACQGGSAMPRPVVDAVSNALRPLLRAQCDYDAFVGQFLEYLSSATLHRSRAVYGVGPGAECHHSGGAEASMQRVATQHDIDAAHVLPNIMRILEIPPRDAKHEADLRSLYARKSDAHSGYMKIGWEAALQFIGACSQQSATAVRGGATWSTANVPATLMETGFHQDVVVACF